LAATIDRSLEVANPTHHKQRLSLLTRKFQLLDEVPTPTAYRQEPRAKDRTKNNFRLAAVLAPRVNVGHAVQAPPLKREFDFCSVLNDC
jgi:hypothetical protein